MASNEALHRRRIAAVPRGLSTATAVFADRALNCEMWDVEGRRYIDFAAGIGVLAVGHRHPRVMAAVESQLARFTHTSFQVMPYEPYVELAERLCGLAPFRGEAQTVLFTTGAEAVENAIKIARLATGRSGVIAFTGAFHGRTALTATLTGKMVPYKKGLGAQQPNVFHVPYPAESSGISVAESLRALEFLFAADIGAEQVAAIIIEPIQGEGGFHVAPPAFLRQLRDVCDRHGILLVADEVQSGFGRTGKMFAIEHSGVAPDLVTVAKSLAGGFPLSGVIGRTEVMDAVDPGGLGGTYAGSPVACAAALAVLEVIQEERLIERADAIGRTIRSRLQAWAARDDLVPIARIRGYGAMIGFDLLKGRQDRSPDGEAAKAVCRRALDHGLVVLTCGPVGETIRLLTPLTAPDAIVDEGLDLLEAALGKAL